MVCACLFRFVSVAVEFLIRLLRPCLSCRFFFLYGVRMPLCSPVLLNLSFDFNLCLICRSSLVSGVRVSLRLSVPLNFSVFVFCLCLSCRSFTVLVSRFRSSLALLNFSSPSDILKLSNLFFKTTTTRFSIT